MAPTLDFKGMMAPTFAPFTKEGALNLSIIPRYAQFLHGNGVTGVFVNGSIGEGVSMTTQERMQVAEAWVKCKDTMKYIVIHVGGAPMPDIVQMAKHAESLGVSGISSLPPLYDKPASVQDLVEFCRQVAAAAPSTPFLYYHIPIKTAVTFPMNEFLTEGVPKIPTLSGMKFTSLEVEAEGAKCLQVAGRKMTILSGFDQTLSQARALGFPGAINGGFNFMPLEGGRLFCLSGATQEDCGECKCNIPPEQRKKETEALQKRFNEPWNIINKNSGGYIVSGAKMTMQLLTGLDMGPPRTPIMPLSTQQMDQIRKDLVAAGFKVHDTPV